MSNKLFAVVTSTLVLIAGNASASSVLYATASGNRFGTIDLQTGSFTETGTLVGFQNGDIARLPGGVLYGMDNNSNLHTIDPVTAEATLVGPSGNGIFGIEFRQDGTLFGASFADIFTIDPTTGAATLVGPTGVPGGGYFDLAFDDDGNLYLTKNSALYSVDISTGEASLIGQTGFNLIATDFEDGTLYGFTVDSKIISIDLSTGAGTLLVSETPAVQVTAVATAADQ